MLLTLAVAVCLVSLCFFGHLTVMESLRWLITAKEEISVTPCRLCW